MNAEEAQKVFSIVSMADGGCVVCVRKLAEQLAETFPEHPWMVWFKEWDEQ